MDFRMLADGDMGRAGDAATLAQNMQGYIIPLFLDLLFIISWIMVAMKTMGGNLTQGRGGGWCRMFILILCVFQSFYGFLVVHSIHQAWSLVMMVFPLVGFIAFQGNNAAWLLGYCAANLFTYQFSGLAVAQNAWNNPKWATPNTLDAGGKSGNVHSWDWSETHRSPCWAFDGHNSFCKWGWARTLSVFSTINIISLYFTTFAAFSWYAEGTMGGGGQGV